MPWSRATWTGRVSVPTNARAIRTLRGGPAVAAAAGAAAGGAALAPLGAPALAPALDGGALALGAAQPSSKATRATTTSPDPLTIAPPRSARRHRETR